MTGVFLWPGGSGSCGQLRNRPGQTARWQAAIASSMPCISRCSISESRQRSGSGCTSGDDWRWAMALRQATSLQSWLCTLSAGGIINAPCSICGRPPA